MAMCRFIGYIGEPILMDDLLFKPKNSLINQSVRAHETDEPLNGDGFGIGWYIHELGPEPARFVSVRPAWNDANLKSMAPKILAPCFFAHVRAASTSDVNEYNCHPFTYKEFLFMHNGDILGFKNIKRDIRESLPDDLYNMIDGDTDSEHLFALFIAEMEKMNIPGDVGAEQMALGLERAIQVTRDFKKRKNITDIDYVNVAITNGKDLLASRYISDPKQEPLSLYYSEGSAYRCHDGECRMENHSEKKAVLLVSEKLTSYRSDWQHIPANSFVMVDRNLDIKIRPVNID
jgi:glutamine amidotransferase